MGRHSRSMWAQDGPPCLGARAGAGPPHCLSSQPHQAPRSCENRASPAGAWGGGGRWGRGRGQLSEQSARCKVAAPRSRAPSSLALGRCGPRFQNHGAVTNPCAPGPETCQPQPQLGELCRRRRPWKPWRLRPCGLCTEDGPSTLPRAHFHRRPGVRSVRMRHRPNATRRSAHSLVCRRGPVLPEAVSQSVKWALRQHPPHKVITGSNGQRREGHRARTSAQFTTVGTATHAGSHLAERGLCARPPARHAVLHLRCDPGRQRPRLASPLPVSESKRARTEGRGLASPKASLASLLPEASHRASCQEGGGARQRDVAQGRVQPWRQAADIFSRSSPQPASKFQRLRWSCLCGGPSPCGPGAGSACTPSPPPGTPPAPPASARLLWDGRAL